MGLFKKKEFEGFPKHDCNVPMPKCKPPKPPNRSSGVNKPVEVIEKFDKNCNLIERITRR